MAKAKQNMNLKIQMLAGKDTKLFFERFYKKSQDFSQKHFIPWLGVLALFTILKCKIVA